jgi:nitrogen fixation protein
MSTINYTYNVIVDRFRQFAAGHFQLRRFTHGEISQADLEKEAEWPWLHVKPRAINYSPGTRSFSFEIFISDLPRDKEDKTGYQAESITDCSLIFQDLINEIYLGNMFGSDVVLTRPVSSEPFVEQYTHTLTGVTGTIELNLDYDWSACSIPASWNYNTPTDSGSDGWGALQFIESLDQNGVFVSLDGDVEAPGNSYYYGTNSSGVKGWYQLIDQVGITCEDLPECATIISIVDDIAALQTDVTALQTDVTDLETNKVPYTGATGNVNLGEFELKAGQLSLDTSPTGTAAVGTTRWNDSIGSSETTLKGGSVILKNGVDLVARVVNKVTPNTTLTKAAYQAVRISGAQGQRLAVALAQANNDTNSADTIGVVTETIATNQEGFIMTVGNLEEINTTGSLQGETWADGDVLYLSPTTAGAITNVKPTGATGHIVVIGYVEYAHAIHGKIYVKVMNGWELDELHNVYIDTPVNNNVLTYESSTSLWKNKTVATALGYTPVPETRTLTINGTTQDLSANRTFTIATGLTIGTTPITSGTVGRVLFEGTGNVLQQSGSLFWDNTNSRLGIGTATPTAIIHSVGSVTASGAIARGNFLQPTLVAAANSDVLVGLEINPTFTNGAFTGVKNNWINLVGNASVNFTNQLYLKRGDVDVLFASSAETQLKTVSSSSPLKFFVGSTSQYAQFFATTGNLLLQNGGTFTDAGFKLDVNGSVRFGTNFIWNNSTNVLGITGQIQVSTDVRLGATGVLYWAGRAWMQSTGTGSIKLSDSTDSTFDRLQFGGTSASYPSIKRASNNLEIKNANDTFGAGLSVGASLDASAILQADSTTKGFLPPRMTTTQKNAIASPVAGLVVYDTTLGKLCVRGASAWETITSV